VNRRKKCFPNEVKELFEEVNSLDSSSDEDKKEDTF
jgi:hypothetical protein